ncbi:MAG: hypothetical protein WCS69_10300 [Ignavibacteriaceae bacterium]|jgi:hypothetical protein
MNAENIKNLKQILASKFNYINGVIVKMNNKEVDCIIVDQIEFTDPPNIKLMRRDGTRNVDCPFYLDYDEIQLLRIYDRNDNNLFLWDENIE